MMSRPCPQLWINLTTGPLVGCGLMHVNLLRRMPQAAMAFLSGSEDRAGVTLVLTVVVVTDGRCRTHNKPHRGSVAKTALRQPQHLRTLSHPFSICNPVTRMQHDPIARSEPGEHLGNSVVPVTDAHGHGFG